MNAPEALVTMLDRRTISCRGFTGKIDELRLSQDGRLAEYASDDHLRARIVTEDGRVNHFPICEIPWQSA